MAEDDDDDFSFGDFKFAPSSQPQFRSQPHINGVTSTSNTTNNDVDIWGNFIVTPQTSSQFLSSNGFSPNSSNSAQLASPIRPDLGPNKFQKPKGALPLSLFGEVEDEEEDGSNNNSNDDSSGCFDLNSLPQKGKSGDNNNDNNGVLTKSDNGLSLHFDGLPSDLNVVEEEEEDDGEWEFKGAFSGNVFVEKGILKGSSVVSGSKVEPLEMMKQEKQAGQDASSSLDFKLGSMSFAPQSSDFFAASYGFVPNHQTRGLDVGFNSIASTANSFMWDPFPRVESIGNGTGLNADSVNQDDDFDEFGDFIDASQEIFSNDQEQVVVQMNHAEAQISNGEVQEKQTQTGYSREALPLYFFSDETEEPIDGLDLQNEVGHIATLSPGNSFNGQGSAISVNDLISKLYSQAQLISSANSTGKPAENGVDSPPKVMITLGGDADWDDGSWEFKSAVLENGVKEQLSTSLYGNFALKQPRIFPELHDCTEFYDQLSDFLCSLLSCQLDELKKTRSSDGGNSEAVDDEFQEAFKLLEESINSKEALAEKDLERESYLNKLLEVLQGPKFNLIESDFQLSKRLQLAEKEWRIAVELLRHAMSMLKILSLGVADEQSLYASTWSKIINVGVQELRHGASIWKRASEKILQHQILSNSKGQQNILALGEIYKVVKLLGLSAKVYMPFILVNVSDHAQIFGILDECDVLWSKLGLEKVIQSLSANADFGYSKTAETLITSINNILDIDTFALHGCVFTQCKAVCQLSLLPQETLADLKTVMWDEKAYFLNLANLWANLISCEAPQLPHLQIS